MNLPASSNAYGVPPLELAGDVSRLKQFSPLVPGSEGYAALLHEIGHALGLKHPFEGDIRLDAGCHVSGLVMAEGSLHLATGVVIGTPDLPVSVCADVIEVRGPVLVHGSVQARIGGSVACT